MDIKLPSNFYYQKIITIIFCTKKKTNKNYFINILFMTHKRIVYTFRETF